MRLSLSLARLSEGQSITLLSSPQEDYVHYIDGVCQSLEAQTREVLTFCHLLVTRVLSNHMTNLLASSFGTVPGKCYAVCIAQLKGSAKP